jgi:hypothetical protein
VLSKSTVERLSSRKQCCHRGGTLQKAQVNVPINAPDSDRVLIGDGL